MRYWQIVSHYLNCHLRRLDIHLQQNALLEVTRFYWSPPDSLLYSSVFSSHMFFSNCYFFLWSFREACNQIMFQIASSLFSKFSNLSLAITWLQATWVLVVLYISLLVVLCIRFFSSCYGPWVEKYIAPRGIICVVG